MKSVNLLAWINENRSWIFSGVGIVIMGWLWQFISNLFGQSGQNPTVIEAGIKSTAGFNKKDVKFDQNKNDSETKNLAPIFDFNNAPAITKPGISEIVDQLKLTLPSLRSDYKIKLKGLPIVCDGLLYNVRSDAVSNYVLFSCCHENNFDIVCCSKKEELRKLLMSKEGDLVRISGGIQSIDAMGITLENVTFYLPQ